jgi:hypothetical protein
LNFDPATGCYTMTITLNHNDDLVGRVETVDHFEFEDRRGWTISAQGWHQRGGGDLTVWIESEDVAVWWLLRWC